MRRDGLTACRVSRSSVALPAACPQDGIPPRHGPEAGMDRLWPHHRHWAYCSSCRMHAGTRVREGGGPYLDLWIYGSRSQGAACAALPPCGASPSLCEISAEANHTFDPSSRRMCPPPFRPSHAHKASVLVPGAFLLLFTVYAPSPPSRASVLVPGAPAPLRLRQPPPQAAGAGEGPTPWGR